jgi:hypothetical protein
VSTFFPFLLAFVIGFVSAFFMSNKMQSVLLSALILTAIFLSVVIFSDEGGSWGNFHVGTDVLIFLWVYLMFVSAICSAFGAHFGQMIRDKQQENQKMRDDN